MLKANRKEWKKFMSMVGKRRYRIEYDGGSYNLGEITRLVMSYIYFNGNASEGELKNFLSSCGRVHGKDRILQHMVRNKLVQKDGGRYVLTDFGRMLLEKFFETYYPESYVKRQVNLLVNGYKIGYNIDELKKAYKVSWW